jgi:hypothetical protein
MALRLRRANFSASASRASGRVRERGRPPPRLQDFFLTLVLRQALEVQQDGKVKAGLGRHDVLVVLALQDLLGAVLDEILPASYLDREEYLCLGLGG